MTGGAFRPGVLVTLLLWPWLTSQPSRAQMAPPAPPQLKLNAAAAPELETSPLALSTILESVEHTHPELSAVRTKIPQAQAKSQSAAGAFDPVLSGSAKAITGGYYDTLQTDLLLEQRTPWWGTVLFAGHRLGRGADNKFPPYESTKTLRGGEVRLGLKIPLVRNGPIDGRRAAITRANLGQKLASQGYDAARLQLRIAAATAYFRWVSAGHRLRVASEQWDLAEERHAQLKARHAAGSAPKFDVIDNRQMLASRKDKVVLARRAFESSAILLSLYHRDRQGQPAIAELKHLPSLAPPQLPPLAASSQIEIQALACHPRLAVLRAQLAALRVDVELYGNKLAPDANAKIQISRDLGGTVDDNTLPGTVVTFGLNFALPGLMREARGRLAAARAKLTEAQFRLTFAEDKIRASVQDARSQLVAAIQRAGVAEQMIATSRMLAEGERQRQDAGSGTLLSVNLREQSVAASQYEFIGAAAEAQLAGFAFAAISQLCSNRGQQAQPQ